MLHFFSSLQQAKDLVNELDDDEALRCASIYGHLPVVQFLVQHGAYVHANNDIALYWASENGHLPVVQFLKSLP